MNDGKGPVLVFEEGVPSNSSTKTRRRYAPDLIAKVKSFGFSVSPRRSTITMSTDDAEVAIKTPDDPEEPASTGPEAQGSKPPKKLERTDTVGTIQAQAAEARSKGKGFETESSPF